MGTVHFDRIPDIRGGSLMVEVRIGDKVIVEECTLTPPEGKEFSHWSTEPNGTGIAYRPGQTITLFGDVTLYAQWRDKQ